MDRMRECRNQAGLRPGVFERVCERERGPDSSIYFSFLQADTKPETYAQKEFREALPPCLCLLKGQLCASPLAWRLPG